MKATIALPEHLLTQKKKKLLPIRLAMWIHSDLHGIDYNTKTVVRAPHLPLLCCKHVQQWEHTFTVINTCEQQMQREFGQNCPHVRQKPQILKQLLI